MLCKKDGKFHHDRYIGDYHVLDSYKIGGKKEKALVEKAVRILKKTTPCELKTKNKNGITWYYFNGSPFPCVDMLLAYLMGELKKKCWIKEG